MLTRSVNWTLRRCTPVGETYKVSFGWETPTEEETLADGRVTLEGHCNHHNGSREDYEEDYEEEEEGCSGFVCENADSDLLDAAEEEAVDEAIEAASRLLPEEEIFFEYDEGEEEWRCECEGFYLTISVYYDQEY